MAKILIVDDDPDIVEPLKVVLETRGHEVISAMDGQQGLLKVNQEQPDLVILDVMMPKKDGFEVARKLRSGELGEKRLPILMLTAIKDKMGLDFKNEAGDEVWLPVDDYCEKPIDHDLLIEKVEKLLRAA